ncbi:MAG: alpha/beta hydrolase [Acaryochloridaceae cyanobacterium RL_2_7]|nr:alpha/beta hydrolase [Acaryochloridaceae cyanobacterium RL_2_7]
MSYLKVRDVDHYYEWVRSDSESSAPKNVMVFVHGWGGSCRYWRTVAEQLSDRFDCLLYDLRGFGRSQPSPEIPLDQLKTVYDVESYATDLAALLEGLGVEEVYLHAHSMGSTIATMFVNRYPERVKKTILACNGIFEYDAKSFNAFHRFGGWVVKFRPPWMLAIPGLKDIFMARFLTQSIPGNQKFEFLEDFVLADYQAALGTMLTSVSQETATSMPDEFAQVKQPTLLISGECDQIIPAEMGAKAAELNPQISYQMIEKTGHFPMLEKPEQYLNQVSEFLCLSPLP